MATPILAAKLYRPPPQPNAVFRARLIAQLSAGLNRKLTLISASAGFGKTTLVSAWAAGCGRPVAWLSLDAGDGDPARFVTYLVAALQTVAPGVGAGVLANLRSPQPPQMETLLTALLNDLSNVVVPIVLVLDDLHEIDSRPLDQALVFVVEHLPPQLHLVIASREDPPLPLARLRARGQLSELRAADLRFSLAEAGGFLNQAMGLSLSLDEIGALDARTEGWIAGLQLAALSMQGRADTARFIASFTGSHHFVLDYLVEEVLRQQSEDVQAFLLRTSLLERMCGPLCDAVLQPAGVDSGQMTLEYIQRANLFIVPLDNERRWYRYHHLFADLLRQRLQQGAAAAGWDIPALHRRASAWHARNGLPADAIRHALLAEDFGQAAGLIELAWPAMDANFQTGIWLGWAKALPEALIRARPMLSVGYAWALLNGGALEGAEARLRDAERALDGAAADDAQSRSLPASIATARAYLAQAFGDGAGTLAHGQRALALLTEEDYLRRGPAFALVGLAQWAKGDLEDAHRSLTSAMAGFVKAGNPVFAISCTYGLADIRVTQGRLRAAISAYETSLPLALNSGGPLLPGIGDIYLGLGELHREQGDLQAAADFLLKSEALGKQLALPDWPHRFQRGRARLRQAQGDLDGALDALDEAERLYFRSPVPDIAPIPAMRARVWVLQGRVPEALSWVRERGLSVDDDLTFLREFEHISLARALIARHKGGQAEGALDDALGLLDRLLQAAESGGRMGSAIEILVLQALTHRALGSSPAALSALARALTLAEPDGYVRIFVDEGRPMAALLSEAAARGLMLDYTSRLLAAFGPELLPPVADSAPPVAEVDPLSPRELELLRLVAQGLSNQEIGKRLFLALDTVKGHNRRIYAKLQVQRRTEAVARARELGLI
jgi:LuxR family maltose regulon positive regulatory protein